MPKTDNMISRLPKEVFEVCERSARTSKADVPQSWHFCLSTATAMWYKKTKENKLPGDLRAYLEKERSNVCA